MFVITKFSPIIREVSKEYGIDRLHADKAHDNQGTFDLLDDLNIEPALIHKINSKVEYSNMEKVANSFTIQIRKKYILILESYDLLPSCLTASDYNFL